MPSQAALLVLCLKLGQGGGGESGVAPPIGLSVSSRYFAAMQASSECQFAGSGAVAVVQIS